MAELDRVRFVATKAFLNNILPVDRPTLDSVYQAVVPTLYGKRRWKGFPARSAKYKEEHLYQPFVDAANAIMRSAKAVVSANESQVRQAVWKVYHTTSPQSLEPDATRIRPDCALTTAIADAVIDDSSVSDAEKDTLWWLQFVAVVEAKRSFDQQDEDLIVQLLGYLRLMMVEQKDRRFALGLFLSSTQMSVWLQDRSGVLGMDVPINIHQNPMDFIHIITALAILPAHRLGFDPSMKLAREPLPPIHTYRLSSESPDKFDVEIYKKSNYATQWVIAVENEIFMTLRAMSLLRTDVVHGSGSIVWAVIRYADRQKDPDTRAVYVLKQWWKADGQADEGAIYEYLAQASATSSDPGAKYIGEMECREVVKVEGVVDSTEGLIRRGLESAPPPPSMSPAGSKRPRSTNAEADERLHVDIVTEGDLDIVARYSAGPLTTAPQKRTRMRVVLKTFGCPIKYFTTMQELITCLLHAVHGHRFAYVHGVIQRDVSCANLLITLIRQGESLQSQSQGPRGCLIDFDHAKRVPPPSQRTIEFVATDASLLPPRPYTSQEPGEEVNIDVIQRALHLVKVNIPEERTIDDQMYHARKYIGMALDYYRKSGLTPPSNHIHTPETLGWDAPLLRPPTPLDTTFLQSFKEPRSGTPPYASAKILNAESVLVDRVEQGRTIPSPVLHDALHDMESFFWVLLYLSITRSGPGGDRREELRGELSDAPGQEDVIELRRIMYCFFDGDLKTIAYNKKELFEKSALFEPLVLCHVHPYFEPLKPLLRRWWHLLRLAYRFEGYEYHNIHNFVIKLLEKTLEELRRLKETPDDAQRKRDAAKQRTDFVHKITHADLGVPASPTRSTSPSSTSSQFRVTTAFDLTPEAQRQQRSGTRDSSPSSPTSPTTAKKAKR
ncbi:hypothetical protein FKP32DRAFT_1590961 [Trametes sanguinea]|nr:hypothetical protein FKP32DRAFT_1590961 [Trametes sanguinea]